MNRPPPAPIFNHKNKRPRQAVISEPSSNFDQFTKQSEQLNSLFAQNERWNTNSFRQGNMETSSSGSRAFPGNQPGNALQQKEIGYSNCRPTNQYKHNGGNMQYPSQNVYLENRQVNQYPSQANQYASQAGREQQQYQGGYSDTCQYNRPQDSSQFHNQTGQPNYRPSSTYSHQQSVQYQNQDVYSDYHGSNRTSNNAGSTQTHFGQHAASGTDSMTMNVKRELKCVKPPSLSTSNAVASTSRASESASTQKPTYLQTNKQDQKNESLRKSTGKEMVDKSLRIVTTSIAGMKRWSLQKDSIQMVFEVLGMVITSPPADPSTIEKEFVIKDEKDTLTCVFFEIDRSMPTLMRGQWHRIQPHFQHPESSRIRLGENGGPAGNRRTLQVANSAQTRCVGNYNVSQEKFHCVSTRRVTQEERKIVKLNSALVEKTLMKIVRNQREA